jgi:hypothetical protein
MTLWLCATCGLEHADTPEPPDVCAICSDERQYIPPGGQKWTTLETLQQDHSGAITELEPGLHAITITPKTGIGHQPLLITTPAGNVLWDPPGYIDDALISEIQALGGIAAITSSHPHLTGLSVTWSQAFGDIPIWYNAHDERWIRRPDDVIRLWRGRQQVLPGITLIECGGHFAGSAVLHWRDGAEGRGAILTGDTIRVVADRVSVTFMRSYPNSIPLSERSVRKIVDAVDRWPFDRIYSGFQGEIMDRDAKDRIRSSADRYVGWIHDELQDPDEPR